MLIDVLAKNDKKGLFSTNDVFPNYSSGFDALDYMNAFYITYYDNEGNQHTDIVKGVIGGRFITIFGSPGTGKTTLADQIAWNIIGREQFNHITKTFEPLYSSGVYIHADIERTAIKQRILDYTHARYDDRRLVINSENTTIEDIMDTVNTICDAKEAVGAAAMYEIDGKWFGKDKVKVYQPTIITLDSLPSFVSKDMKIKELEGQTSTIRDVAQISQFYVKMLARMTKYNIIIIAINHLKPKPNMSMYDVPLPQLLMLKKDESLPRGQAPVYYASLCMRINQCSKGAMYTVEDVGFDGFKATIQVAKTKTAFVGGAIPLAFNSAIGYDPVYSLLEFAIDANIVEGRQPYLYIKGAEAHKFSKRTFREKFIHDEMFAAAVYGALLPVLKALVGVKDNSDNKTEYIPMSKLFITGSDGSLIPSGMVETDRGIEVYNAPSEVEDVIITSKDAPKSKKSIILNEHGEPLKKGA